MTKKTTPIISIRVTDEEKDMIKELADKSGLTITDYIKQKALYEVTDTDSNVRNTEDLQRNIDALQADTDRLNDLLEAKDVTLSNLSKQLEQANKRIDDYSRQLEQQQSLQLATVQTNRDLQLKLESLEAKEEKERKGFWSSLFSRD